MKIHSSSIAAVSVVYLAFPVVIFIAGWLRPVPAVAVIALLAAGVLRTARRFETAMDTPVAANGARVLAGFLPVLAALLLSGAGGVGPQTWDWLKHDALFKDLVTVDWPVLYEVGSERIALVYGLGWYLPPAMLGKVGGWDLGYAMLFAWTAAGVVLVYAWLVIFAGGAAITAGWVFVLFSGWDAIAALLHHPGMVSELLRTYDLEFAWLTEWAYPSHFSMLVHAPQHTLPAWLGCCLLIDLCRREEAIGPILLILALSTIWSPFSTIALLPFATLAAAPQIRAQGVRALRSVSSATALAALAVAIVACLYYLARFAPYELPDRYYPPVENRAWGDFLLLPLSRPPWEFIAGWTEFLSVELAAVSILVVAGYRRRPRGDWRAAWFMVALAWLAVLPIAHYGLFNDLSMRGSTAALLVVSLAAIGMLLDPAAGTVRRALLCGALLLGALNPLNMLRLDVEAVIERRAIWFPRSSESVPGLLPFQLEASRYWNLTDQYLGSPDTVFFRWLAGPSRPDVVE